MCLNNPPSGRNIFRVVFRSSQLERNELFLPGRMAYVVDLDDEFTDTDIPTTLIRSKADCPSMEVHVSVQQDTCQSSITAVTVPPDGLQLLQYWSRCSPCPLSNVGSDQSGPEADQCD